MRKLAVFGTIWLALAPAGYHAQETQRSGNAFRTSVDLIVVNVVAVDKQGQPVEDLAPRDFLVKVDGRQRDVVSAQLVKAARDAPVAATAAPSAGSAKDALVATNTSPIGGRFVAIAVDQTLIAPGSITPLLGTASQFVERLTPLDYAALVTFPEPGPHTDFTTDKTRVRQALQSVVGQPQHRGERNFNISLSEARIVSNSDRLLTFDPSKPKETLGVTTRTILERGCRDLSWEDLLLAQNADFLKKCVQDIYNESYKIVTDSRADANIALRGLETFVRGLIPIEGPKSLVMISAGLALENESFLDDVVRLAAAARTSVNVIAVDPERDEEIHDLANGQSRFPLQERAVELEALRTIADRTGGSFQRAVGRGDGNFNQLTTELSAWYVVAVARKPGDPDRQRVEVDVRRRGVTTRANRTVVTPASLDAGRSHADLLSEALSSPIALAGVPLRMTTFTRRDSSSGKYQVRLDAQIGQPGTPTGDFALGHLVMDARDRVVASQGTERRLSSDSANQPLRFDTEFALEPGAYTLRFGVVDAAGRRGTIMRQLELAPVARAGFATSDLVVGSVPRDGESMRPSVEPHVDDRRVAANLEMYLDGTDDRGVTATLEIAEGDSTPALTTAALTIVGGAQANWRIASGAVDADLLPGPYIARVIVRRGTQTLAVVQRPFVFERSTRPTPTANRTPADRPPVASTMPADLQLRTSTYIGNVVASLSNVVAQEEFVLERPDRKVISDFLLVRYPGSDRDFLTYRDVMLVDGKPLPGREQRLLDLFLKPPAGLRERAREITTASQEHVPPSLNPIFVLAFLQSDYQRRFELTTSDAGPEWPAGVKAVAFVETARPTLLRAGPFGDFDVPTRGTAWIEVRTGRILQTELEVGIGRSRPRTTTRFGLDPRLQIVVPQQMRTENPTGVATYSNFRRFRVDTDTAIADKR
jgi:VWFA-related protein